CAGCECKLILDFARAGLHLEDYRSVLVCAGHGPLRAGERRFSLRAVCNGNGTVGWNGFEVQIHTGPAFRSVSLGFVPEGPYDCAVLFVVAGSLYVEAAITAFEVPDKHNAVVGNLYKSDIDQGVNTWRC